MTFRGFIEAPYPIGVGSTIEKVSSLVGLSHRYEAGSPERAARLAAMREKVRFLIDADAPVVNPNGANQWSGRDISQPPASGQRGTSRAYNLARLKRDRPDLAEMVSGGAMSAICCCATARTAASCVSSLAAS